jgi:hypothetical protein
MASKVTKEEYDKATEKRNIISKRVFDIIGDDGVLIYPTVARLTP